MLLLSSSLHAVVTITPPVANDIGETSGWILAQNTVLERIENEFPDLANQANHARLKFAAAFGPAIENMNDAMAELDAENWGRVKTELQRDVSRHLQELNLNEQFARDFIAEVLSRATGELDSPIIETLLMFHPTYQQNPAREYSDGFAERYHIEPSSTTNRPGFHISAPKSWSSSPGDRPNTVIKFNSQNGRGLEVFTVLFLEIDLQPGEVVTTDEIVAYIQSQDKSQLLPAGSRYLESGDFSIEGLPGYWIAFDQTQAMGRHSIETRNIMYSVFYENFMIQLGGMVGTPTSDREQLNARFQMFEPLFELIALSFVLPDAWSTVGRSERGNQEFSPQPTDQTSAVSPGTIAWLAIILFFLWLIFKRN